MQMNHARTNVHFPRLGLQPLKPQLPPRIGLCPAAGGAPWGEAPKALRGELL